ncbi:uncharacterized protein LOC141647482 [Silene latifolia]|uniref:uncharacterized protein LOC141647482 n=1 Tax=Silene latifolia TaxID=37657 RepID=UPI003D77910D
MSQNDGNNDQANNELEGDYYEDFGSNGVDYLEHFITSRVFPSSKESKFKIKIVEVQVAPPQWLLYMGRVGVYNHAMVAYNDGDRYYSKLDDEELVYIDAQVRAHVPPAMISVGLHKRNPGKSRPTRRQIYNLAQKARFEEREEKNPAQQMLALAVQHYVHFWVTDQSTSKLTHVFLANPETVKMFRSYYYVVIMDSAYETKTYSLALIEMVGVKPVGKSFVIAYAFVKYESDEG